MKRFPWRSPVLAAIAGVLFCVPIARAAEPAPLGPQQLDKLHAMLKPQPGESPWMEIDWYPSVWEARQKAAAEGKPMFFMAGSGGAPAAGC